MRHYNTVQYDVFNRVNLCRRVAFTVKSISDSASNGWLYVYYQDTTSNKFGRLK